MEELKVRPDGTRLTRGPGVYKIPSADDAPRQFHVKLLAGSSNKSSIFSSKVPFLRIPEHYFGTNMLKLVLFFFQIYISIFWNRTFLLKKFYNQGNFFEFNM